MGRGSFYGTGISVPTATHNKTAVSTKHNQQTGEASARDGAGGNSGVGVVGDVATPLSQHADGRHWLTVRDTWGTPGGGGEVGGGNR